MPRKQNGFGSASSFAFKGSGRVDRGKSVGAFGQYPSDRRFGASVHRTVIENWNLNSDWTKWRRGYELYNLAAFAEFTVYDENYNPGLPVSEDNPQYRPAELQSKLYQGTDYEVDIQIREQEDRDIAVFIRDHVIHAGFSRDDWY